jgi:lysophospholipid acyltransferase (LPLAT)-like uncharacterized protein
MNAIHTVFRLMGLKRLLLGSSGEEGKQAARELAGLVQNGRSTTISPDGPYGLPRTLKKGVLPIALQSGVPVVPITICSSRFISWRSWDSKRFPLPFNRIKVIVHEAIHVNKRNFEQAGARIVKALGVQRKIPGCSGTGHAIDPKTGQDRSRTYATGRVLLGGGRTA